jgi:hypothetical protein
MNKLIACTFLACALGLVHLPSAGAAETGRDPNGLIGVWRCSGPAPGPRPEIVSIQPDGYAIIDAAGHIIVGRARIAFPAPWEGAVAIAVEESDIRDSVGTTVSLGLKINSGYSVMGIGFENDRPFALNRLCHRIGAKP